MKKYLLIILLVFIVIGVSSCDLNLKGDKENDSPEFQEQMVKGEIYTQSGIGRSIDVVSAKSYNDFKDGVSVFKSEKLKDASFWKKKIEKTETKTNVEQSIIEQINNSSISLSLNVGSNINVGTMYSNISHGFEESMSVDVSNYSDNYYYTADSFVSKYSLSLPDYLVTSIYIDWLSNDYISALSNLNSNPTEENYFDFYRRYGTHIIGKGVFGGRATSYYIISTNKHSEELNINSKIKSAIDAGISSVANMQVNSSVEGNLTEVLKTSDFSQSFYTESYGGSTFTATNVNEFNKDFKNWLDSFNTSDNYVLIDFEKDNLVPLWNLLPSEYSSLRDDMIKHFLSYRQKNYDSVLVKFENKPIHLNKENFSIIRNNLNGRYILDEDIDLSDYIEIENDIDWLPIGAKKTGNAKTYEPFTGYLDGNGKKISLSKTTAFYNGINFGIFGILENATIKNLNIDVNIVYGTGDDRLNHNDERIYIGGLAGIAKGNTNISNCKVSGKIQQLYTTQSAFLVMGGLVGKAIQNTTIIKCSNSAKVYGQALYVRTGGIAGRVDDTSVRIDNCSNQGYIRAGGSGRYGNGYAGSIVGAIYETKSNISNCTNSSTNIISSGKNSNTENGDPIGRIFTIKDGLECGDGK